MQLFENRDMHELCCYTAVVVLANRRHSERQHGVALQDHSVGSLCCTSERWPVPAVELQWNYSELQLIFWGGSVLARGGHHNQYVSLIMTNWSTTAALLTPVLCNVLLTWGLLLPSGTDEKTLRSCRTTNCMCGLLWQ
jgi:hypothetical protein